MSDWFDRPTREEIVEEALAQLRRDLSALRRETKRREKANIRKGARDGG